MSALDDALGMIDEPSVTRLAQDMIDIPSPVGSERRVAEYLAARFRAVGLRTSLQEVEAERFNVFGVLEGTGGGPTLLYGGHLDTAYGGDEDGIRDLGPGYQPKSWVEDEWVFGLGAFNMKSGHAASILAVEALARAGARLRGDLIIGGMVGETCHVPVGRFQGSRYRGCGVGARFMLANGLTADMAVFPEPTSNTISIASGGYVYFELVTRGYPGITFRRGASVNKVNTAPDAIDKMFAAVPALKEWGAGYLARSRYRGVPAGNVDIIAIDGGHPFRPTKRPCKCHLYFEVGFMPGQNNADIVQEVRDCTRKLRRDDPDMEVEVNVIQTSAAAEVSPQEHVVRAIGRAHEDVWGERAEVTWDGWYADTAPLTRAGIPSICYGPQGRARSGGVGDYPHDGEQANVVDLAQGSRVFVKAAHDICMADRATLKAKRQSASLSEFAAVEV